MSFGKQKKSKMISTLLIVALHLYTVASGILYNWHTSNVLEG